MKIMNCFLTKIFLIVFIIFSFSKVSIASKDFAEQTILDRLSRIERDMSILQKQFYSNGTSSNNKNTAVFDESEEVSDHIKSLISNIEEANHRTDLLEKKYENTKLDVEMRLTDIEKKLTDISVAIAKIDKKLSANNDKSSNKQAKGSEKDVVNNKQNQESSIDSEYKKACDLFSQSKFDLAETAFLNFIKKHGNHKLVGNSYYWLGEIYFNKKNYEKAALNYLYSYNKFPSGSKVPASVYKLSKSLIKLNKTQEACNALDQIINEISSSPQSLKEKALSDMEALNCKEQVLEQ